MASTHSVKSSLEKLNKSAGIQAVERNPRRSAPSQVSKSSNSGSTTSKELQHNDREVASKQLMAEATTKKKSNSYQQVGSADLLVDKFDSSLYLGNLKHAPSSAASAPCEAKGSQCAIDQEKKASENGAVKDNSASAKVSDGAGSLAKTSGSAKVSDRGDFVESGKSSICRGSTSTDVSDESTCSSFSTSINKPHKANDSRWEAIQAIRAKDGTLDLRHFRLLKKLGSGDIGSVYLSELCGTKCYFAMKVMDKASLAGRKKLLRAQTEREILQSLDHPFLPTLYTHFETEKFSCLVMEFCPGGDLHTLRQRQPGKHFSEQAVKFYVAEILLAMEYLHMLGIVYRDLKPENVLVREDGHIMLSDFDLSLRCTVSPTLVKLSSLDVELGQLGRMLCEAASQMAIKVIVLDPMVKCPASALAHQHVVGSYDDSATVEEFGKRCGVLTVEIEHVDVATLEKLEQQGVDCQPKASTIRIIQDKYLQKVHFSRHGIPLPKFMQIDNLESARRVGDMFGYPLMIKSRRLAYDGRGNAVAKSEEQLSTAVNALGGYDRGLYVEQWAPFVKELSVIVARGRDNSIACYPAVETIHRDNICHIVKSPANVSWKIMKLATDVAQRAVSSLEGAGVFAVELFLTEDGQILLNEVAPRPHNSGHHTIEACFTSQYEQHLRAVVGLPLGDPSMKTPAAVMYNILGEDDGEPGFLLANQLIGRALGIPGASIHWYDKPEMRRQRKMGHITIVGSSMGVVEAQLKVMLNEDSVNDQPAVAPRVGIIMGSDSDLPVMKDAAKILKEFDVHAEVKIVSAHRTPEMMFSYALSARERGIQVIIAGAGGAAHLPGMVAALTPLPVIGVPVRASTLDGLDSLLSIVQMPRGVPVATVAINNATNAGLLAVRLLGISDINLQARMVQYQEDRRDEVLVKGERLEKVGYEEYLNS